MADIPATSINDILVGTPNGDLFFGTVGGAGATLSSSDTISGGNGIDAIQLSFNTAGGGIPEFSFANVTGVETLSITGSTGFGQVTDLDSEITTVNVSNQGSVGLEFNGDSANTIALNLTNVVESNGQLATIDFDDIDTTTLNVTASGTAAALGIANAANGMQVGPDAVTALNINSIGATANVLGVSGTSAITSLTLTGNQDITLVGGTVTAGADPTNGIDPATEFNTATGFTALRTVNALGFSGDLTLNASNAAGPIVFIGGSGNDQFTGGAGGDQLIGGAGDDNIDGGLGSDFAVGDTGNDQISGGAGSDIAFGGFGNDIVFGGSGITDTQDAADLLYGNAGSDQLFGNAGNDTIFGGDGFVDAADAADTINGGLGNDLIYGNAGADLLAGQDGADTIFGGLGADTINGGVGNDVLYGSTDADLFVFSAGGGVDQIIDFSFTEGDRINAGGQTYSTSEASGSTTLTFADGGSVVLVGVTGFDSTFVA